jgi:hypothetical protein
MQERQARLDAFEARTQRFSIGILKLLGAQPWAASVVRVTQQLAGEFAAKLQVVNEEIDEAVHWLEVLAATVPAGHRTTSLRSLLKPANCAPCSPRPGRRQGNCCKE